MALMVLPVVTRVVVVVALVVAVFVSLPGCHGGGLEVGRATYVCCFRCIAVRISAGPHYSRVCR